MRASDKFLCALGLIVSIFVIYRVDPGAAIAMAVGLLILARWIYGQVGRR
ncbi:MAG: hypothetical protein ACYSUI_14190 [Planctomycetota bacterium]|jgi:hypothetical protein